MKHLFRLAVVTLFALPVASLTAVAATTTPAATTAATPAPAKTPAPPKVTATTVTVALYDGGPKAKMATDRGMGMAGKGKATMGLRVSKSTVKTGDVTFNVTNTSKETVHEMLVIPVKDAKTPPAYDDKTGMIDEDKAGSLGEVSELDPGKMGSVKLTLAPGTYVIACNVANHYANGMWRMITVTK